MQTRLLSLIESTVNTIINYIVSVLSQVIVFPFYDISIPLYGNIAIGVWFTAISIIRSYIIRRIFSMYGRPGRLWSLLESAANIAIGYTISLVSQLVIFPMFGVMVSINDNIAIGLWFTAISLARSYTIRRIFSRRDKNV
jgi:hypothetical protein